MSTISSDYSPNSITAAALARDLWLFELPPKLRANDSHCRAAAARLLQHAPVHSVAIDRHRRRALVRIRRNRKTPLGLEHPHAAIAAEPHAHPHHGSATTPLISWIDAASQATCYIKLPPPARGLRKALLLLAAGFMLLLGLLGVVLPGLPTTPFVLLASVCLLRSSPQLPERLLMSRLFGGVLRDWHLHRGIRPHVRYKAMIVIALVVAASLLLTSLPLIAKLAIAAIAACGVTYVWRLPDIVEHLSDADQTPTDNTPSAAPNP